MSIGRRGILGLSALGLSAVALDGCGTRLPWDKAEATLRPEDIEQLLLHLDLVVKKLRALQPDAKRFGVAANDAHTKKATASCIRILTSICFLGTYRDVPEPMWREPRVVARLSEALPEIHATVQTALAHLSEITDEDGERIDALVSKDPQLTMRIMERIDEYAQHIDVPIEQRTYLRTETVQLSSRLKYEGVKPFLTRLVGKYKRGLASRSALLGMPTTDQDQSNTAALGVWRARFHTRATASDIQSATCSLGTKITIDGVVRNLDLEWDALRCPTSAAGSLPQDPSIRVAVHSEPEGDQMLVVVTLYPPDGDENGAYGGAVKAVAEELQRRLSPQPLISQTQALPTPTFGGAGESCRVSSDCESSLVCTEGVCMTEGAHSAKLMKTTAQVAKWGAILLIPPICAVGVLVLLCALFMVIVAGCMSAGGD